VHLADKSTILSTHTTELPFPCLPRKARTVHLFPALKGTSLISVSQLCDVGCTATFHKTHVVVDFQGNTILQGQRCPYTNLWTVDIQQPLTAADPGKTPALVHPQMACNVTLPNTTATLVKHQLTCLFSPVLTTIAQALAASIMPTFPGLTLKALHKYVSPSMHTQKGHMDQARANQASTSQVEELEHVFPKMLSDNETEHYCFAAITTVPTKQATQILLSQTKQANFLLSLCLETNTYLFSIITTPITHTWNQ